MPKADASYPLSGLKVLDMSRVLAGPFAGRMLSDLGADVVKLEPPDGDITRLWGRVIAGIPGYFHQQNAGKRNISVDLIKQVGQFCDVTDGISVNSTATISCVFASTPRCSLRHRRRKRMPYF